jgi:hypothetical protein
MEAVASIAAAWRGRADDKLPRFGLSEPEYFVQLCLIYIGEVDNGGHAQFFMNRGGRYIDDTLRALTTVGLAGLSDGLKSAVELFPGKQVPEDRDAAERAYSEFSDRQSATLAGLDRRCFELDSDSDKTLLSYLQRHRDEILVPERALSGIGHAANSAMNTDTVRSRLRAPYGAGHREREPSRRATRSIDAVWARIKANEGQRFRQIRGQEFSYTVAGSSVIPSTTKQNISRSQIAEAMHLMPLSDTQALQHLRGPSYLFAILMDPRIRGDDW